LHSGRHDDEAQLYAFDIMVMNGDDLRELPLFERKEKLAQVAGPRDLCSAVRAGRIGPDLFERRSKEGLVSKHCEPR
jgi:ATP-dependent DNA ligase